MTTEAPWWGIPVVAGLFTLLGVALSQVITYVIERGRSKRLRTERWDDELRQCAARFLQLVDDEVDRWGNTVHDEFEDHLEATITSFNLLLFVSTDEIATVARDFMDLVYGMVLGSLVMDGEDGDRVMREITLLRRRFVGAVRRQLGVDQLSIELLS